MIDTNSIRTELNSNERAVSPVIGVILMVAITVILAAVIGTFVLGLGGDLQESAPSATITIQDHTEAFDESVRWVDGTNTGSELVTLSHEGGDEIAAEDIRIAIRHSPNGSVVDEWEGGSWDSPSDTVVELNGNEKLVTGDFISTGDKLTLYQNATDTYSSDSRYDISLIDTQTDQTIASSEIRLR